jgi:hypothetical protein
MAEADLRALVAYLRRVPAVERRNRPKQITVPLSESVFLPAWLAAFTARLEPPPVAPRRPPGWPEGSIWGRPWGTAANAIHHAV